MHQPFQPSLHLAPRPQCPMLTCFSHLPWNLVFQRPQVERAALPDGLTRIVPILPAGML